MSFQPMFGHLFASGPTKVTCCIAIATFEVGSLLSALAVSSPMLILGRAISGIGGAGLYIGTLSLTAGAVPIQKRPAYISLCTSMFGLASIAGPLLGGVFSDSEKLQWQFCFWINLRKSFQLLYNAKLKRCSNWIWSLPAASRFFTKHKASQTQLGSDDLFKDTGARPTWNLSLDFQLRLSATCVRMGRRHNAMAKRKGHNMSGAFLDLHR
jgi:MFS family permease